LEVGFGFLIPNLTQFFHLQAYLLNILLYNKTHATTTGPVMPIVLADNNEFNPRADADVTYTVIIDSDQRALITKLINYGIASLHNTQWLNKEEEEMALSLKDMLDPAGSTGDLVPSPSINSFVL
jgi:hypothetical protein